MNPEQFKRLKDIFIAYQELDPDERSLYLEKACRGDEMLRAEAEKLLESIDDDDGFLEKPALMQTESEPIDALRPGTRVGAYRLGHLLYTDASIVEYEAHDEGANSVTVKMFRPGVIPESTRERFDSAARQLAALSHPGIAKVLAHGSFAQEAPPGAPGPAAMPYLVTESTVDALPMTEFVRMKKLSLRERLRLFLLAGKAVAHAHGVGILHRDLQPSTVLIDVNERITIVNFGVMHVAELDMVMAAAHAEGSGIFGPARSWSPEQCRADRGAIDGRSDVFSLGMILFELLCDEPPHDVRSISSDRAARPIATAPPKSPSLLNRSVKGDLEAIVLKALEKERSRRYQSVTEFNDDIDRFLRGALVHARHAGWAKRTWKRIARALGAPFGRMRQGGSN